jgi:hypothetical protein
MFGVPPDIQEGPEDKELQRSEPNGLGDVAGAPDYPVHHATGSPTKRLVWRLGL